MDIERANQLIAEQRDLEAVALLESLVASGSVEAMGVLGMMLGLGSPAVPADGARAEALLLEAISKGNGAAAHNLGTLYAVGAPGCERRPELTMKYYRMARDLGFQVAPDEFYK